MANLLEMQVKNKRIFGTETRIVRENINDYQLMISLDEEWADMEQISVVFYNETIAEECLFTGEAIPIPSEIMAGNKLFLTVVGLVEEPFTRLATMKMNPIHIVASGQLEGEEVTEATPTLFEQYRLAAEEILGEVIEANKDGSSCITEDGGFAGGYYTTTSTGAALGKNAKAMDAEGNPIDAIQLGTGTNSVEKTMQVYDYPLLDAGGKIVTDRLPDTANVTYGDGLQFADNVLSVDTTDDATEDNTKPITSGAVYREIGNIDALLELI